jgi:hypothetical protein
VAEAVERVERERGREDGLARELDGGREARDERDDVRGRERTGRDEVAERVRVQHWRARMSASAQKRHNAGARTDGEARAGDAVRDRAEPRQLRLVDGEVRAGGPREALLVQDLVRRARRERLGLHAAAHTASARARRGGRGRAGAPLPERGADDERVACGCEGRLTSALRRAVYKHIYEP